MKWLEDQVASIREAATQALQKVAQEFGGEWAKENLVPPVCLEQHNATHYVITVMCIVSINSAKYLFILVSMAADCCIFL